MDDLLCVAEVVQVDAFLFLGTQVLQCFVERGLLKSFVLGFSDGSKVLGIKWLLGLLFCFTFFLAVSI